MKEKLDFYELGKIDYIEGITQINPNPDDKPGNIYSSNVCSFLFNGQKFYVCYGYRIYSTNNDATLYGPTLYIVFQKFIAKYCNIPETLGAIVKRINPDMEHMNGDSEIYKHYSLPVNAYYCVDGVMAIIIYFTVNKKIKFVIVCKTVYGHQVTVARYQKQRMELLNILKGNYEISRKVPDKEVLNRLVAEAI